MASTGSNPGTHLRLIWPEWQGAGSTSVEALAPEFPFDVARRSYTVGTRVLQAVLPPHDGPTAVVPVGLGDEGLEERDGIEAKTAVLAQLDAALGIIRDHDPERITTLGGDCGVSMAPFAALAERYGDDLAVLWVDSHPDMGDDHVQLRQFDPAQLRITRQEGVVHDAGIGGPELHIVGDFVHVGFVRLGAPGQRVPLAGGTQRSACQLADGRCIGISLDQSQSSLQQFFPRGGRSRKVAADDEHRPHPGQRNPFDNRGLHLRAIEVAFICWEIEVPGFTHQQ